MVIKQNYGQLHNLHYPKDYEIAEGLINHSRLD